MQLGLYPGNVILQPCQLFQHFVVNTLELFDGQFRGTLVKNQLVDFVHEILDIPVFLICRHIFTIVYSLTREGLSRQKLTFHVYDMLQ